MAVRAPATATGIVSLLFFSGLASGALVGRAAAERAQDPYINLDLFARVLTLVENEYVDLTDDHALVSAGIEGMIDELDPHSRYLSPEDYRSLRKDTDGRYVGIGVEVETVPEGVLVLRVFKGSPARRDGLESGDRIVAIDGTSVAGVGISEVSALLSGERGTAVVLGVRREGVADTLQLHTVRDQVHAPAVESARLDGGLIYLRLVQFQDGCADELQEAFDALTRDKPAAGLVLDLRDNPGGLLTEAVAVGDLFLDEGLIVTTKSRSEGEASYPATRGGFPVDLPIVVLVNGGSASASEIVAGALQDSGRARLLGTHTYGKGSVQTLHENADHSAIKLTTGLYFTPSGEPVAPKQGRTPDIRLPMPTQRTARDELRSYLAEVDGLSDDAREQALALEAQLGTALPVEIEVDWSIEPAERGHIDPQLAKALALLSEG